MTKSLRPVAYLQNDAIEESLASAKTIYFCEDPAQSKLLELVLRQAVSDFATSLHEEDHLVDRAPAVELTIADITKQVQPIADLALGALGSLMAKKKSSLKKA